MFEVLQGDNQEPFNSSDLALQILNLDRDISRCFDARPFLSETQFFYPAFLIMAPATVIFTFTSRLRYIVCSFNTEYFCIMFSPV